MRAAFVFLLFGSFVCSAADMPSLLRVWSRDESVLLQVRALDNGNIEVRRYPARAESPRVWRAKVESLYVLHNRLFGIVRSGPKLMLQEFEITDQRSDQRLVAAGALGAVTISIAGVPLLLPIMALTHNDQAYETFAQFLAVAGGPGIATAVMTYMGCQHLLRSTPRFRPAQLRRTTGFMTPVEIVKVVKNSLGAIDDIIYRDANGNNRDLNATLDQR